MKRFVFHATAVLFVLVSFFGCKKQEAKEFVIATGGTSGVYYPLGNAIAEIWNNSVEGIHVTARATGGSVENMNLLNKGEVQLAIVQNDIMDYAYRGIYMFSDRIQNLTTIGTLYDEVVHIVASKKSGIQSVDDFRGKRISIGDVGSGCEFNAKQILEGYGIELTDIQKYNLSYKDAAEAIKSGQIDACFIASGVPNAAISELAKNDEIVLIPVMGAPADKICNNYNFYTKTVIPPRTYENTTSGIPVLAVKATLAISSAVDEEIVYDMTKALFDNLGALGKAHAKGKEVSPKTAVAGVSVPFHNGAIRYFSDMGLTIY